MTSATLKTLFLVLGIISMLAGLWFVLLGASAPSHEIFLYAAATIGFTINGGLLFLSAAIVHRK